MNVFEIIYSPEKIEKIRAEGDQYQKRTWYWGNLLVGSDERIQTEKGKIIRGEFLGNEDAAEAVLSTTLRSLTWDLVDLTGISYATLERYGQVARRFDLDLQERFDVLPFSHFRFVMRFPGFEEDILETELRCMDSNGGKPFSEKWLKVNFRSIEQIRGVLNQLDMSEEIQDILHFTDLDQISRELEVQNNQWETGYVHPLVFQFVKNLDRITEYMQKAIETWGIEPDLQDRIINLIEELNNEFSKLSLTT